MSNEFPENQALERKANDFEKKFEYCNLSPEEILLAFLEQDQEKLKKIQAILQKIEAVAHVGFEVADTESFLAELQRQYPERSYQATKTFPSVSVPQNYDNSTGLITCVESLGQKYPGFELFTINWQGKYESMPEDERAELIKHAALRVTNPSDVQEIIDQIMAAIPSDIKSVMQPLYNQDSGETFGYLINNQGMKIEIMHRATKIETQI